jgi:hypothetical protein
MSDNFFVLVPEDPVGEGEVDEAVRLARAAWPAADSVSAHRETAVQFFDCGGNFEAAYCPHCGREFPISLWQDLMSADYGEDGFILTAHEMPCCGTSATLNDLRYDWPQAFGTFALEVMNPNVAEPGPEVLRSLGSALGSPLRVVRQHL